MLGIISLNIPAICWKQAKKKRQILNFFLSPSASVAKFQWRMSSHSEKNRSTWELGSLDCQTDSWCRDAFKAEMQYKVSGEKRVGADVGSWAMEPTIGQSPVPFLYRANQGKQPVQGCHEQMCMSVHTRTHAQTHAPRGETGSTKVVGLAPKAWSEIKYQECAGRYSLSFLIQTGGRSEETRDLWGEVKRNTMMLMLRNRIVILQEQSVESLPVELGNKPARVCAISLSYMFAYVCTNTHVLLVLACLTVMEITRVQITTTC